MKSMKKLFALVLVIVSVLAIALPAMAVTTTTTVGGVNVRRGPGTGYARVGDQIAIGSTCSPKFQVYGTTVNGSSSHTWYYVENINCACGNSSCDAPYAGYIHASCLGPVTLIYGNPPDSKFEAFGPSTLSIGSWGLEVYNLQLVLWENECLGDMRDMSDCDGVFGNDTAEAVKEFQRKYNLDLVDGLVGNDTKTELWYRKGTTFNHYGADPS